MGDGGGGGRLGQGTGEGTRSRKLAALGDAGRGLLYSKLIAVCNARGPGWPVAGRPAAAARQDFTVEWLLHPRARPCMSREWQ